MFFTTTTSRSVFRGREDTIDIILAVYFKEDQEKNITNSGKKKLSVVVNLKNLNQKACPKPPFDYTFINIPWCTMMHVE